AGTSPGQSGEGVEDSARHRADDTTAAPPAKPDAATDITSSPGLGPGAGVGDRVLPPPPVAPSGQPGRSGSADPTRMRIGSTEFNWPVPDKTVQVAGRNLSVEVAGVAALYAVVGLWVLWSIRELVTSL